MKQLKTARAVASAAALYLSLGTVAHAALSLSAHVSGSFANVISDSSSTEYRIDNDLTNGHPNQFDLYDRPAFLTGNKGVGPAGSAAFEWGEDSNDADYSHTSALWFRPNQVINASAETPFILGYLYYRNGTIENGTGADGVTLNIALNITSPLAVTSNTNYDLQLINTSNSGNADASADIVKLGNVAAQLDFTDDLGNGYFLEMTFQVDLDNTDGTLSSLNQFRVHEGGQGVAVLIGRFTTTPITPPDNPVPETETAALLLLSLMALQRRRRNS